MTDDNVWQGIFTVRHMEHTFHITAGSDVQCQMLVHCDSCSLLWKPITGNGLGLNSQLVGQSVLGFARFTICFELIFTGYLQ